ncbi:MAG: GNAT family N-acetyltransferase [Oscillospiraceae bacterium]|jgi:GNAT superfamily N-acetyltransferase|nr:GNAT family N-acetyltransferase [Oscillospiraceae bacterium]
MKLEIKPLTPALAAGFFDFFDNRAFTDRDGAFCYCTWFHCVCSVEEHYQPGRDAMRECAGNYIKNGVLNGYLVYDGNIAAGWCNTDKKENYPRLMNDPFLCAGNTEKTKAVVCFEIAPEYRGKGIAAALLARICDDAKAQGYDFVESYPASHQKYDPFDYAGPARLYEKLGFVKASEQNQSLVMRKELR